MGLTLYVTVEHSHCVIFDFLITKKQLLDLCAQKRSLIKQRRRAHDYQTHVRTRSCARCYYPAARWALVDDCDDLGGGRGVYIRPYKVPDPLGKSDASY